MANILIVDDDKRITDFLCDQLKIRGHACRYENRGAQILEKVNMAAVDLLILDVMLPDVSGFEVCRRIRANTDYYTLPILFLSSMDSEEEINHGLAQGADDYVTKPFTPNVLLNRIENLLTSSAKTALTDDVTGLPNSKSIKSEIQKAISRKLKFTIGYVELMGINDFHVETDREQQLKALRHFARCLQLCARQAEPPFFAVGHMGGGHFVFIIAPDKSDSFVHRINDVWGKHLPGFFESVGKANQIKTWKLNRTLEFMLCVTNRDADSTQSSRDLFDTLSHLRATAEAHCHSGVFRDRRQ